MEQIQESCWTFFTVKLLQHTFHCYPFSVCEGNINFDSSHSPNTIYVFDLKHNIFNDENYSPNLNICRSWRVASGKFAPCLKTNFENVYHYFTCKHEYVEKRFSTCFATLLVLLAGFLLSCFAWNHRCLQDFFGKYYIWGNSTWKKNLMVWGVVILMEKCLLKTYLAYFNC